MDKEENIPVKEIPNKKKSKRRFFNKIAMFCNHLSVIALLISYLAPRVSPQNFWFIAFFGISYPILVFVNFLFVIYWSIQLKKRAMYSLIVILSGWMIFHRFVQWNMSSSSELSKNSIKIMSYNVKVFDLYNWSHNKETRAKIFNLVNDEEPQIACFQEFFHRDSSEFSNVDSLKKLNNWPYAHVVFTKTVKQIHHWGIATFSKFPIIKEGMVDFGYAGNNICIFSDLQIGKDTVRIYNMHLQSIAFSKNDYKLAESIQNEDVSDEDIERSKNIIRRLKHAFIKRANQADLIAESISSSPYPVIVCGDFNDTPSSYAYSTISNKLKDSFIESGSGFGKSYVGAFPSFRIDYILHSDNFKSAEFRTIREELSDHFPIVTYLEKSN